MELGQTDRVRRGRLALACGWLLALASATGPALSATAAAQIGVRIVRLVNVSAVLAAARAAPGGGGTLQAEVIALAAAVPAASIRVEFN